MCLLSHFLTRSGLARPNRFQTFFHILPSAALIAPHIKAEDIYYKIFSDVWTLVFVSVKNIKNTWNGFTLNQRVWNEWHSKEQQKHRPLYHHIKQQSVMFQQREHNVMRVELRSDGFVDRSGSYLKRNPSVPPIYRILQVNHQECGRGRWGNTSPWTQAVQW